MKSCSASFDVTLVGKDFSDVDDGGRGTDHISGFVAHGAAALVEVERLVPLAVVAGIDTEVVEHVALTDEIAELLVQGKRHLVVLCDLGTSQHRVPDVRRYELWAMHRGLFDVDRSPRLDAPT